MLYVYITNYQACMSYSCIGFNITRVHNQLYCIFVFSIRMYVK